MSFINIFTYISKWNVSNLGNVNNMFISCYSLVSIPDLSKWNTYDISIEDMFDDDCINSLNEPLELPKKIIRDLIVFFNIN